MSKTQSVSAPRRAVVIGGGPAGLMAAEALAGVEGVHTVFVARRAGNPVAAGPIAVSFFALDLVARGAFFDVMEHFDLAVTHLHMNRAARGFVWYCFAFRMYYGLTLLRIAVSFVWIWTKISAARRGQRTRVPGPGTRPDQH